MKSNKLLLMVLVMIMFVLAACSPAVPTTVAPPTTKPTEAQVKPAAKFPTGRFVSAKDKAVALQYNEDGSFAFYFGGKDPVVVGTYTVKDNLITSENPTETDPKCKGPATYQWSFDGEQLTFAPTGEDSCKGRRDANADTYVLDMGFLPNIKIDAADYSYTAPDSVSAGWVRVTLTNTGSELHHVQFLRLNDGVNVEQFQEALKQGEGPALALVKQVGGVGSVAPTGSAQAVLNLPAGEYVILCFIPSPADHVPHFAKGMIKSLTVRSASDVSAGEPPADLTIHLRDFSYDLPETLPAAPVTIKVVNDGPEAHEFNIMRLADGKSSEDVLQYLNSPDGPPPFTPVGGMNGLDMGLSGYVEINLQPGKYVAICNIPSPKAEGQPHFMLGMIKEFTVASTAATTFPTGKFVSLDDKARGYQFNEDGTFAYYLGGMDPVVEGNYTVVGDLLSVINPSETDPKCQGSVTYHWFFDQGKLNFTPFTEDACKPRSDSFSNTYIMSK